MEALIIITKNETTENFKFKLFSTAEKKRIFGNFKKRISIGKLFSFLAERVEFRRYFFRAPQTMRESRNHDESWENSWKIWVHEIWAICVCNHIAHWIWQNQNFAHEWIHHCLFCTVSSFTLPLCCGFQLAFACCVQVGLQNERENRERENWMADSGFFSVERRWKGKMRTWIFHIFSQSEWRRLSTSSPFRPPSCRSSPTNYFPFSHVVGCGKKVSCILLWREKGKENNEEKKTESKSFSSFRWRKGCQKSAQVGVSLFNLSTQVSRPLSTCSCLTIVYRKC